MWDIQFHASHVNILKGSHWDWEDNGIMKNTFFSLLLLSMAVVGASAQTMVKGDMNGDGQVTISDVTSVVNVILGKSPVETINIGGSPYQVDNSYVVGTWYAPDGTHFTFNTDGTTDFPGSASYRFYPGQNRLLILNASGRAVQVIPLVEATSSYLLAVDYATGSLTYYTNSASLVTSISLSQTSLTMNSNETVQLTATVSPSETGVPYLSWSSSDESVATVDQDGLVTAVAGGTCTITATATDGSGTFATSEVTVIQLVTSITLSETAIALEIDGYKKLTAMVLPSNASNPSVRWSSSDDNVAEVTSTGGVVAVGKGTCTITCATTDGSGVSTTCRVYVNMGYDGFEGGYAYMDLGLPSGTLWAAWNVGADNPEDYGDYFAWGETTGYNSGKTTFSWSTYTFCNGSSSTLTKYCNDSSYGYNGFTDSLTELELSNDAAYVNWGSDWRMPSKAQFDELINSSYTTTTWTKQNEVYGSKITSKTNGNSIFLPATGYRSGTSLYIAGSSGDYWSRTLETGNPGRARDLYFDSGYVYAIYNGRCNGRSVRPVRVTQQ